VENNAQDLFLRLQRKSDACKFNSAVTTRKCVFTELEPQPEKVVFSIRDGSKTQRREAFKSHDQKLKEDLMSKAIVHFRKKAGQPKQKRIQSAYGQSKLGELGVQRQITSFVDNEIQEITMMGKKSARRQDSISSNRILSAAPLRNEQI
jgi:hypothetical protein